MNDIFTRNDSYAGERYEPSMIFNRVLRLTGEDGFHRLQNARVILFGLGGVGSWTAEALVRSGIGHIAIVDADRVAVSNINRQLPAMTATVGRPKTEVMVERLREINPDCDILSYNCLYTKETSEKFGLQDYDYVIDAIDSLADKASLILNATSLRGVRLVSSMGAALKMDPTKISVAEFWKVTGCPLAAALRRRFKKSGEMPRRNFKCVFSPELIPNRDVEEDTSGAMSFNKVAVNGAMCHITAIFGMTLAGLVIEDILKRVD